jgi:hypothetical protein
MTVANAFPMTRQGVRNLNNPRRSEVGNLDEPMPLGVRELDRPMRSSGDTPVNVGEAERGPSALIGATLAGFGLGSGKLWGLLLATVGCGMVCRGLSGHCAVYAAAGINTAH